jgi:hypothetical protein
MSVTTASPLYSLAQVLIAVFLMVWSVSYFYQDRQLDQCLQTFNEKAKVSHGRSSADVARGQRLQARASEIAKGSTPKK